jgi:hypothetical protein
MAAVRRALPEGSRVRLTADAERFPHFIARAGSTGVVNHNPGDGIAVKLDRYLPGAEEWDNEVWWMIEDCDYPDGWRDPEVELIARRSVSQSFAVKFEESMPDGEPVAFVSGAMAQGAYVVEPVSYDESGPVETAWVLSGHGEHEDPERAEPWLDAALNALASEWWMRGERARQSERAAGWDDMP